MYPINICRSPMAEYVMRSLLEQAGLSAEHQVASAATSAEELGNPVYPPIRKILEQQGIDCSQHQARQVQHSDYEKYDRLIVMDRQNQRNLLRILGDDPEGKIHLLLEYAGQMGAEVADPWYTRDFQRTFAEISAGCQGLLKELF